VQVDHQKSLLDEAIAYRNGGQDEFAIVFYATWVEHWVNGMILVGAARKGLEPTEARQFIRETGLRGKVGHLWRLLFGEPFPDCVSKNIDRVAMERNAFVHYKWPAQAIGDEKDNGRLRQVSALANELVSDLIKIEERIVFVGRRDDLARIMAPRLAAALLGYKSSRQTVNPPDPVGPDQVTAQPR
jgi:hypothetical protein